MSLRHILIVPVVAVMALLGGCSCSEKIGTVVADCPKCGYLIEATRCNNCGASRMFTYNGAAASCSKCGSDHFTTLICPKCKTRTTNLKVN